MKKSIKCLSVLLVTVLLLTTLILPANATEHGKELRYWDRFENYITGGNPQHADAARFYQQSYDELYYHTVNGETDWALVYAEGELVLCVIVEDIICGRAFSLNEADTPFELRYGIYDVKEDTFYDLIDVGNSGKYDGLSEALDELDLGEKIVPAKFGENLQYKDAFLQSIEPMTYGQSYSSEYLVKSYDELYYHQTNGETDWVLVWGETFFALPYGGGYRIIGDRVIKTDKISEPFDTGYAIYDINRRQFRYLSGYMLGLYSGLAEALEKLNIGRKIGDINGDGRLNIKDTSFVQRCIAEMNEYPDFDGVEAAGYKNYDSSENALLYISDVNKNKVRDIGDATAIQRILAEF